MDFVEHKFNTILIPFYFSQRFGYFFCMKQFTYALILFLFGILLGCAGRTSTTAKPVDPTSVTEVVVGAVGGIINATSSVGTPAFYRPDDKNSFASKIAKFFKNLSPISEASAWINPTGICPSIQFSSQTTPPLSAASTCLVSGKQIAFGLSNCNYASSIGVWGGVEFFTLDSSTAGTSLACKVAFPFQANDRVRRSFGPGTARVSLHNLVVLVDTSGIQSGWSAPVGVTGETITYGANNLVSIDGVHLAASMGGFVVWDYTINTPSAMTVVAATGAVTTGSVTSQLNTGDLVTEKVGTTNLAGITFAPGCCWPTAGTVTTSFVGYKGGVFPSESMTFVTPCGTATLDGRPVTLEQCF
jgi:hypothetical protein